MSHLRHRTIFFKSYVQFAPPHNLQKTAPGTHFYRWVQLWQKFTIVYHPLASRICIKKTCKKCQQILSRRSSSSHVFKDCLAYRCITAQGKYTSY